jgi:trk system potassium uptake protein
MIDRNRIPGDRLVFRLPGVSAFRLPLAIVPKPTNPLSSTILLAYTFAGLVILGAILLILPVSSNSGQSTSFLDALFTATSAVCTTGLVLHDTLDYWSTFGQAVLLVLFQIGGAGYIAGTTLLILAIGGKFGLTEKLIISESLGIDRLGGVLGVVVQVLLFSLFLEAIGVVIFYFHWAAGGNPSLSLWTAVFHAASSFNNCGMDLFGHNASLSGFASDPITLLTTCVLVVFGGISYVVIIDIIRRRRFSKMSLDSKVVLVATLVLLVISTVFIFVIEYASPQTLGPLSLPQKWLVAFTQAVVPRTAGFSIINVGQLKEITLFFTIFLMFIGGSAGSTAGGLKVNAAGVIFLTVINTLRGNENVSAFGRQITREIIQRAVTLFTVYLGMVSLVCLALSLTESFPVDKILFESVSAMGTVGLSTGITPDLSTTGRIIITITMFIGRLGPLTLMAVLAHRQHAAIVEYPHETVRLG